MFISESSESTILPLLFSSPTTATMNFLTLSTIYCLYPSIANEKIALTTWNADITHTQAAKNRGIHVSSTMFEQNLPCNDETCDNNVRKWNAKQLGIGQIRWNPTINSNKSCGLEQFCSYHWKHRFYSLCCPDTMHSKNM